MAGRPTGLSGEGALANPSRSTVAGRLPWRSGLRRRLAATVGGGGAPRRWRSRYRAGADWRDRRYRTAGAPPRGATAFGNARPADRILGPNALDVPGDV